MKKTNVKMKQYSIVVVLVVICVVLVGMIYSVSKGKNNEQQVVESVDVNDKVEVDKIEVVSDVSNEVEEELDDAIVVEQIDVNTDDNQEDSDNVAVEQIVVDDNTDTEISVIEVEEVDEPIAEEPDKPEQTPPEEIPETIDDLTDPDKVPEYEEEETTYVSEPEPEELQEIVRGSNQVPDSENPFLQDNIPSSGDSGEVYVDDISEYEPGTGDKF